jgi:LysM repeat protein
MITTIRIFIPAALASALLSCSPQKPDSYDTPPGNPYGAATPGNTPQATAPAQPANPIYDSPAAYEDSAAVTPVDPNAVTPPDATLAAAPAAPATPAANGAAVIHTVVKGDTLSGISAKYKIPSASIKQANRMTNDTVVLGRKMVIPPL